MGISIQYRGQLDNPNAVSRLVNEVIDIAEVNGWSYSRLDESWQEKPSARLESARGPGIRITGNCGLRGMHFIPHEKCEAVWLYFNANGIMSTPFQVALEADTGYPMTKVWLSTKTQFAGPDTHMAIITLFQYLKEKYISDLEVKDEAGYWENPDPGKLKRKFETLNSTFQVLDQALDQLERSPEDDAQSIARKIKDILREIGGNDKRNDVA